MAMETQINDEIAVLEKKCEDLIALAMNEGAEVYGEIASPGADVVVPLPSYYDTDNPTLVSADRGTILMPLVMTGSF